MGEIKIEAVGMGVWIGDRRLGFFFLKIGLLGVSVNFWVSRFQFWKLGVLD